MPTNPEALFDCFIITRNLERALKGISASEVNLYAYLACLLGLFSGKPISQWGYRFVGTEWGAPYSVSLMQALEELETYGDIAKENKIYTTTKAGQEKWGLFSTLTQFSMRRPFINAATDSVLSCAGIEVNPFLKFVSETKLTNCSVDAFDRTASKAIKGIKSRK